MKDLETLTNDFASRLKAAMKAKGYSQTKLSEITGISIASISHYVNGHFLPNAYTLYVLCCALNCTPNSMLGCWKGDFVS